MKLGLADGLYNEAYLSRGERAAMIGVAVGGQALFESGETMYPLTQVAPGGSRGDVGTVKLCQLRAAILPDAERFHATKLLLFHRIDEGFTVNNRQQLTITDGSQKERARKSCGGVYL